MELTFVRTSPTPFKYNESYVTAAYSSGPFNRWGGSTGVNYTSINKLPPLRLGSVSAGQTAHGFVAIDLGGAGDWYIEVDDPDNFGDVEAGWKFHP
jgi:hypothetical protein